MTEERKDRKTDFYSLAEIHYLCNNTVVERQILPRNFYISTRNKATPLKQKALLSKNKHQAEHVMENLNFVDDRCRKCYTAIETILHIISAYIHTTYTNRLTTFREINQTDKTIRPTRYITQTVCRKLTLIQPSWSFSRHSVKTLKFQVLIH